MGAIVRLLGVHTLQLLVALSHAVPAPQLVAQAFALLSQDVNLFDCRGGDWTRRAAVSGEAKPRQSGIRLGVIFAQRALVHTEKNSWNRRYGGFIGPILIFSHQQDQLGLCQNLERQKLQHNLVEMPLCFM